MDPQTPVSKTESEITFHAQGFEIMRLDSQGMTYGGQRIEDAGQAHRAYLEVMARMTADLASTDELRAQNASLRNDANMAIMLLQRIARITHYPDDQKLFAQSQDPAVPALLAHVQAHYRP